MEQTPYDDGKHETVFDVPIEHIVQSSSGKGWHGLDIAEIIHPLDDFALPALPRHILVINLSTPATINAAFALFPLDARQLSRFPDESHH